MLETRGLFAVGSTYYQCVVGEEPRVKPFVVVVQQMYIVDDEQFAPAVSRSGFFQFVGQQPQIVLGFCAETLRGTGTLISQPVFQWHFHFAMIALTVGKVDVGQKLVVLAQLPIPVGE